MNRRHILWIIAALLLLTVTAGPAVAARGGKLSITISLASSARVAATSGSAEFTVTRSAPSDDVFWVTNRCFDSSGAEIMRHDAVVSWGTSESLVGAAGSPTAGASCTAYVTLKPWAGSILDRAVITYTP